ncbi:hypothetical protein NFX46_36835 [Streptomyces phaeoluteigriseus]|uniref:Secreted protein n=1 Tax=Streptomyces phaeoluteigriseus TaxID=114686 RepID=A0A1V6MMU3_9ACTN|nr:hypothetical protein [Streptomyces phaeoluteigriseus]OQD53810.1 hypothetical protein BM536_026525 [Streptomyces phaeoluteigriseus]USQ88830.1 hypothetical protein NFX46_36835 [Streptomyces phaeoluteigriseus]
MRSMLRLTVCTVVAVAVTAVGAGSASASTLTGGAATTVTVPAVGEAVANLLGALQGLAGLHGEPEWS